MVDAFTFTTKILLSHGDLIFKCSSMFISLLRVHCTCLSYYAYFCRMSSSTFSQFLCLAFKSEKFFTPPPLAEKSCCSPHWLIFVKLWQLKTRQIALIELTKHKNIHFRVRFWNVLPSPVFRVDHVVINQIISQAIYVFY